MAADGTLRGGARAGSGRKKKPANEQVTAGKSVEIIQFPDVAELEGAAVPEVKDYMQKTQEGGKPLGAVEIANSTWEWLKKTGCVDLINPQLVEQYAMSVARWIQCQNAISEFGFLSKHPTTGAPIVSPFVTISQNYQREINVTWQMIWQVIKDNCTGEYTDHNADVMEQILSM